MLLFYFCQQPAAIHFRHSQIRNDNIHRFLGQDIQSFSAAVGEGHLPFMSHFSKRPLKSFEHHDLIIDKQDPPFYFFIHFVLDPLLRVIG